MSTKNCLDLFQVKFMDLTIFQKGLISYSRALLNKIQNTKLIHAKLKNGSYYKYVWLGNDNFSKMFETWDYESNQGKFKGLLDFDQKISYYFDYDEFKNQKEIIGIDVEDGLKDSEIVDFTIENVIWEQN